MRTLLPYLVFYWRQGSQLIFGIMLTVVTLLASVSLLAISSWFLVGTVTTGIIGLYNFNYMLPAAGVRIMAIIRTAGRWAERVVSHDATFRVLQHLRLYIFNRIFPLSPGAIAKFHHAELLNCLVADVDTLDHLYLRVISPLVGALVITLIVSASFYLLDPISGAIFCIIIVIVLTLFPILFYHSGNSVGKTIIILRNDYRLQLNTWLSCNAELTLYGSAQRYRQQLDNIEQCWQAYQRRKNSFDAVAQNLILMISGLTLTLVLWLSASSIEADKLSTPYIALFAFVTLATFEAFGPVSNIFQHIGQVIASATRLNAIINHSPVVTFPDFGPLPATSVFLKINRVQFHYPEQATPAIDNLSLTVAAGEHIAILGHTGSGKSTLLQLLTRAWDPESGNIMFNNIPLQEWNESALRTMTTVIPQRVYIFSATLRDNLLLAAKDASDEQLCTVLQQVGLAKLLINEGLNAWLGAGGRALSVGEQRRIGIARAILHKAPLWLLDEPTEGLDIATEHQIIQLLATLSQGRTVIIVTHRLWDVENLDRICIMDRGKLIEEGSHQELMMQRGHYYDYHQQLKINYKMLN